MYVYVRMHFVKNRSSSKIILTSKINKVHVLHIASSPGRFFYGGVLVKKNQRGDDAIGLIIIYFWDSCRYVYRPVFMA